MKFLTGIIFLLTTQITPLVSFAAGGSSVGNGGSVVVDGTTYDLADLHFVPLPADGFTFDDALKGELQAIEDFTESLGFGLARNNDSGRAFGGVNETNFWKSQVFSSLIEYKFVAKLPADCQSIPTENLPGNLQQIVIGCTQGSITYIIPFYFEKLTLVEKALLIVHERLHSFAPTQSYDVKTDVVRGFYILRTHYQPAYLSDDPSFVFSADEITVMNRLSFRCRQLSEDENGYSSGPQFAPAGAILYNSTIEGDVLMSIKTSLKDCRIKGTQIDIRDARLAGTEIEGNDISLRGTKSEEEFRGNNLQIHGEHIHFEGSSYDTMSSTILSGSQIMIKNSKIQFEFFSGEIHLENVQVSDSELVFDLGWQAPQGSPSNVARVSNARLQGSKLEFLCDGAGCLNVDQLSVTGSKVDFHHLNGSDIHLANFQGLDQALKLTGKAISVSDSIAGLSEINGEDISAQGLITSSVHNSDGSEFGMYGCDPLTNESKPLDYDPRSFMCLKLNGHHIKFEHVQLSYVRIDQPLENVTVSQSSFIRELSGGSVGNPLAIQFLAGTTVKNIASFIASKEEITFGSPQGPVLLDGYEKNYALKDGWFSRAPRTIADQRSLDQLENN